MTCMTSKLTHVQLEYSKAVESKGKKKTYEKKDAFQTVNPEACEDQ